MTPLHDPGEDPAAISDALPHAYREQFWAEHDEALDAGQGLERSMKVRALLRQWRLRAIAYARPGYAEAVLDAVNGHEDRFVRHTPPSWKGRV